MAEQPALFDLPAQATAWADVRPGWRVVDPPGGPWTVRRATRHPHAPYLLIIDLVADDGRSLTTWAHRHALLRQDTRHG